MIRLEKKVNQALEVLGTAALLLYGAENAQAWCIREDTEEFKLRKELQEKAVYTWLSKVTIEVYDQDTGARLPGAQVAITPTEPLTPKESLQQSIQDSYIRFLEDPKYDSVLSREVEDIRMDRGILYIPACITENWISRGEWNNWSDERRKEVFPINYPYVESEAVMGMTGSELDVLLERGVVYKITCTRGASGIRFETADNYNGSITTYQNGDTVDYRKAERSYEKSIYKEDHEDRLVVEMKRLSLPGHSFISVK